MSESTQNTVAFLGLGAMGVRMAERLIDAGVSLRVWNRTASRAEPLASKGAHVAATPAEAAQGADAVIAIVRDDDAAEAVWFGADGAASTLGQDALAIDCSTLSPQYVVTLGERIGERFVESPVIGTLPHAEKGGLTGLLGGTEAACDRAAAVMLPFAGKSSRVGPVGSAAKLKLINNALFATQVASVAEALASMRDGGLDVDAASEVLFSLAVASPSMKMVASLMRAGDDVSRFPIDLVRKDLDYALAAAGGDRPLIKAALGCYDEAAKTGHASENISAVRHVYVTGS